jgi:hypothetical protein
VNGTLQLQRFAHEEIGFGTWSNGDDFPPITKRNEVLATLDFTNIRHPCLKTGGLDPMIDGNDGTNVSMHTAGGGAKSGLEQTDAPTNTAGSPTVSESDDTTVSPIPPGIPCT